MKQVEGTKGERESVGKGTAANKFEPQKERIDSCRFSSNLHMCTHTHNNNKGNLKNTQFIEKL